LNKTFLMLGNLIREPLLSPEEERKRGFVSLFLLLIIPTLVFLTIANWRANGLVPDVMLGIGGTIVSLFSLFALRYLPTIQVPMRMSLTYTLLMLIYLLATGGGGGLSYLWFYFFPLIAYFFFGTSEGFLWFALSWVAIVLFMLFNLGTYVYPLPLSARMLISYSIVGILAHGMEWLRNHYYEQLLGEKRALEEAMHQVKTLQMLLPICASCKNVRDDGGYWHQVEAYIHEHAGIEFSHSICPDCRARLYPTRSPGIPSSRNLKPSI